jgi:hypothetical protein
MTKNSFGNITRKEGICGKSKACSSENELDASNVQTLTFLAPKSTVKEALLVVSRFPCVRTIFILSTLEIQQQQRPGDQ